MTKNRDNQSDTFYDYCSAMSNFYGRIPVVDAFKIIDLQNPEKYTIDDFWHYLEDYQNKRDTNANIHNPGGFFFVFFVGRGPHSFEKAEIVTDCYECACHELKSIDNPYFRLVEEQKGRPLYVPSKKELLKYSDDSYYAPSPELDAVVEWVLQHQCKLPFTLTSEDIITEVMLPIIMDSDPIQAVSDLIKWLKFPEDEDEVEALLSELSHLVQTLHNNTRMWYLRGHTPEELDTGSFYSRSLRFPTKGDHNS